MKKIDTVNLKKDISDVDRSPEETKALFDSLPDVPRNDPLNNNPSHTNSRSLDSMPNKEDFEELKEAFKQEASEAAAEKKSPELLEQFHEFSEQSESPFAETTDKNYKISGIQDSDIHSSAGIDCINSLKNTDFSQYVSFSPYKISAVRKSYIEDNKAFFDGLHDYIRNNNPYLHEHNSLEENIFQHRDLITTLYTSYTKAGVIETDSVFGSITSILTSLLSAEASITSELSSDNSAISSADAAVGNAAAQASHLEHTSIPSTIVAPVLVAILTVAIVNPITELFTKDPTVNKKSLRKFDSFLSFAAKLIL